MRRGELVIDSFAGGGGASLGIEQAVGRPVDIAINHDREAVAMHQANHPATRHQARRPERAATARTRAAIEGERDRVLELFIRGEIDAGRKDAYLSDIDRRLGSLPPDIDSASFAVRRMREFAEVWALASPERRFEAVRILLRSVRLDVRNGSGHEIRLDPWPDYIPLFRWRREFVGGIRPGGVERSGVTLWLPDSYAPAELGVVA